MRLRLAAGAGGDEASPITSAPGGTVKVNRDGSSGGLRSSLLNSRLVVCPSLSASCMNFRSAPSKPRRTHLKSVSSRFGSIRTHSTLAFLRDLRDVEVVGEVACAAQQHRRRRRQRVVELAHRDLLEVAVVEPDARAVGDDHLLVRLRDSPSGSGPDARSPACRSTSSIDLAVAVGEHLLELRLQAVEPLQERLDALPARLRPSAQRRPSAELGRCGEKDQRAREARAVAETSSGSLFGRRRREHFAQPLDCSGPTRPAASIVSIMRAARL